MNTGISKTSQINNVPSGKNILYGLWLFGELIKPKIKSTSASLQATALDLICLLKQVELVRSVGPESKPLQEHEWKKPALQDWSR